MLTFIDEYLFKKKKAEIKTREKVLSSYKSKYTATISLGKANQNHFIHTRRAIIPRLKTIILGRGWRNPQCIAGWCDYKMVQQLWKAVWRLNDLAVLLLDLYPKQYPLCIILTFTTRCENNPNAHQPS